MPNEVHVVDSPQGFAVLCAGDPNGAIRAPKGTLALDNITPAIWQNTNGVTTWAVVGSGGAGGFPITEDDGTNTYTIDGGGGALEASNVLDADNDFFAGVQYSVDDTTAVASTSATTSSSQATFSTQLDTAAVDAAPFEFSWNGEAANVAVFAGDPNGNVTAEAGSLCLDTTTPAVWQNTDGADTWTQLASASGFPVGPLDDGTNTYQITAATGALGMANQVDGTNELGSVVTGATAGAAQADLIATTGAHTAEFQAVADATSGRAVLTLDGTAIQQLIGTGNPNGAVTAPKASMFFDSASGNIYRNTDGVTAWTAM